MSEVILSEVFRLLVTLKLRYIIRLRDLGISDLALLFFLVEVFILLLHNTLDSTLTAVSVSCCLVFACLVAIALFCFA